MQHTIMEAIKTITVGRCRVGRPDNRYDVDFWAVAIYDWDNQTFCIETASLKKSQAVAWAKEESARTGKDMAVLFVPAAVPIAIVQTTTRTVAKVTKVSS